jgi:hypothetical protein
MQSRFFLASSLLGLVGCANQTTGPIEVFNEVFIESGCCGCSDAPSPCDDDDDGGDGGGDDGGDDGSGDDGGGTTTTPADEWVSFEETDTMSLELEVNQVDVSFLLDTTGSMSGTAQAMATEFNDIVTDLTATIPSAAYGYATYRDYYWRSLGDPGDLPFQLEHQVTSDTASVQVALDATVTGGGYDLPESAMEGIYQALTGEGFDQSGDGAFDPFVDVLPFTTSSDAVFGGTSAVTYDASVPGGGDLGGMGFRDGSLPVIVYATDAPLRDPDNGDAVPTDATFAAGSVDVTIEANARGARLIGVATNTVPVAQMQDLAVATGSLYDETGDGTADDPLVFVWTGSSSAFRSTIVDAIEGMLDNVTFAEVTAVVVDNPEGFTTDVYPPSYTNVAVGTAAGVLDFDVTVSGTVPASTSDQSYTLGLEIYGDGTTLLGTQTVTVTVPATL